MGTELPKGDSELQSHLQLELGQAAAVAALAACFPQSMFLRS